MFKKFKVKKHFKYVEYVEGNLKLEFDAEAGENEPTLIHVPSAKTWNNQFKDCPLDKRDEIVSRLKKELGNTDYNYNEFDADSIV